jgi:hypothetical protein
VDVGVRAAGSQVVGDGPTAPLGSAAVPAGGVAFSSSGDGPRCGSTVAAMAGSGQGEG